MSSRLSEIELIGGIIVSVTHDAHEPITQLAHIDDSLSLASSFLI